MDTLTTYTGRLVASGNTGTAIALKAEATNARIMGVKIDARVDNFDIGLSLNQTSTDLSKFITDNEFNIKCTYTLRALVMTSSYSLGYGVDGNLFNISLQPKPGTTVAGFYICGQANTFNLLPWDWDTVVGTAPYAIVIAQYSRKNTFFLMTDQIYVNDNSTEADKHIFLNGYTSQVQTNSISGVAASNLLYVKNTNPKMNTTKKEK